MVRNFLTAAAGGLMALLLAAPAGAANITWGLPTGIAGDTDVSTTGTLVGAFNVGGSATAINGVSFQPLVIPQPGFGPGSVTSGNFSLATTFFVFNGTPNSAVAPYASLSSNYRALLGTDVVAFAPINVTMSGLTIGQSYSFQAWVNDPGAGVSLAVDVTGGVNVATIDPNPSQMDGGTGQFVVGTFTADASSQVVSMFNSEATILNAFQLRSIPAVGPGNGPSTSVPLPAAVWPGLTVAAALIAWRLRGTVPAIA